MGVGERQRYEEVCKLLESLYAQEFMNLRRNIKNNFLAFSVGAKGQELATRVTRGLPTKVCAGLLACCVTCGVRSLYMYISTWLRTCFSTCSQAAHAHHLGFDIVDGLG
jgi:hypothetical protein